MPTVFWPALASGANGMTSGRTRRGTKRRTHQRDSDGAHRGARGPQNVVPLRDARRRDSLRFVCQHWRGGV
jgi:hypothetical protein